MISARGRRLKGDRAEREVVTMLRDHLGDAVMRLRTAQEDHGDIGGVIDCTIQVKSYDDLLRALREGLAGALEQKQRSGTRWGAAFVRRRGGSYMVVMSPEDFISMYREAIS